MAVRVHTVAGNGEIVEQVEPDDEGAPPALPPGGRVHSVDKDGGIQFAPVSSSSPQSEADLIAKRDEAAAKLASKRAPVAKSPEMPMPGPITWHDDTPRATRLRCLEIASRGGDTAPGDVIAAAKALYAWVEQG